MVTVVDNESMGFELGASIIMIKACLTVTVLRFSFESPVLALPCSQMARHFPASPSPRCFPKKERGLRRGANQTAIVKNHGAHPSFYGWRKFWPAWTSNVIARESNNAKILLVEDNEMNRDMLLQTLQRREYIVVTAQ